jgi:purine-nucleoside phosphorylase
MPVHIRAQPDAVAPVVLLPGDPQRATRAAGRLGGAHCYNENRGLLGYSGDHQGTRVSVQTTGMGAPSAAIVAEELSILGARTLIRIGTCGATRDDIRPTDLIVATSAVAFDGTTRQYLGEGREPEATERVVRALIDAAGRARATYHVGPVATEDALYIVTPDTRKQLETRGVLAQEMEASAIFAVASLRGMEAGCLLTVSNAAGTHERLGDDELLPAIDRMIAVALDAAATLSMPPR